jgi:hypothetical protein
METAFWLVRNDLRRNPNAVLVAVADCYTGRRSPVDDTSGAYGLDRIQNSGYELDKNEQMSEVPTVPSYLAQGG